MESLEYDDEFRLVRAQYPDELSEEQIQELLDKYDEKCRFICEYPCITPGRYKLNKSEHELFYKTWFKNLKYLLLNDEIYTTEGDLYNKLSGSVIYEELSKFLIEELNKDNHGFCEEIFDDFLNFWSKTKMFQFNKSGALWRLEIGEKVYKEEFYNEEFSGKLRKKLLEFIKD
jgi:hypothetical protein